MRNLGFGLIALLGLTGVGCEENGERTLYETEIQGPIKVRLIHHDTFGKVDHQRLEGVDGNGNVRFSYNVHNSNGSYLGN